MSKFLLACLFLIAAVRASGQQGYVSGTVAAVAHKARAVTCGGLSLVVSGPASDLVIRADENGDYAPRLAVGRYKLRKVLDRRHLELRIRDGQALDFVVTEDNVTRFDVLLEGRCPAEVRSGENDSNNSSSHITFSLVHGSAGFVPSGPGKMMTDAPFTVLAFTANDGHRSLVMADSAGDYTAVLQPGRYSLSAYLVKTGDLMPLDPRQQKCIDVSAQKDVRLDVMLTKPEDGKRLPSAQAQEPITPPSRPRP